MGEPTLTSVYWKDDNVKDEGAPDPRTSTVQTRKKAWNTSWKTITVFFILNCCK
jgi:hypothetical protein